MKKLTLLKQMYELLKNPNYESLNLSIGDAHKKGIFSLVIKGTDFGKLTRVFIVSKKIKPFDVQLHTHRYPIKLTSIKGNIRHHIAKQTKKINSDTISLSKFEYKSPLNGGNGLKYKDETTVNVHDYALPIGSTLNISHKTFQTISCSKGSMWIIEEKGFKKNTSKVLGTPFITDGLYKKPKPSEIKNNMKLVAKEIKKMITNYELINNKNDM